MAAPSARTPFGIIAKTFAGSTSNAISYAFGLATAPLLAPILEEVKHKAWEEHASKLPDAGILARAVSTGQIDPAKAAAWAKKSGYDAEPFAALVAADKEGPPLGLAVNAKRRGVDIPGGLHAVYERHGIEDQWFSMMDALVTDLLDPAQLAAAIHRGLVPDPGLLKGEQPTGPFNVEAYPVYNIDAIKEAAGSGYDAARLGVLVGLQGLPMGTHEAAQAYFRGILERGDYIRAFNESNSRNEWADAVLEQARQIPTARDYLENALRGYSTLGEAVAGAARHGMSLADATLIYQNQGRPMALRQITQALARGAKFNPEPGEITDPYLASIVEGSLKPGYYELAEALRYANLSPFVIRGLAQSGAIDHAETLKQLLYNGWEPTLAAKVATQWSGGTAGGGSSHVPKAQTQLWGTVHRSYLAGESDDGTARAALLEAGVPAAELADVLRIWGAERDLIRKQLTPAQVKKAYAKAVLNEATGAPWTRDEALEALLDRGYSHNDATTFLES